MIVTTTNNVDGRPILDYKGVVFGEVITGINMFRDIGAGIRNIFGGRSQGYEEELQAAREEAIQEMCGRAQQRVPMPLSGWMWTMKSSALTTGC